MDHVLPILIDTAETGRDKLALAKRDTAVALAQAQATLQRLEQFRRDLLARSPSAAGRTASGQSLLDYQRFLGRLDEAVLMQRNECAHRLERDLASQAQLAEGQRRLMAFQTLSQRRAALREHKQARVAQRESDEFAARSARAASSPRF